MRSFIVLILLVVSTFTKAQWVNASRPIVKPLTKIKEVKKTVFVLGENFVYRGNETDTLIELIKHDSITYDDVTNDKDTFFISGHYFLNSFYQSKWFVFKLFPNKNEVDTNWYNIGGAGGTGHWCTDKFNDSVLLFYCEKYTMPSNYQYRVGVFSAPYYRFFKGSLIHPYIEIDDVELNNYYIINNTLFLILKYQPQITNNTTLLVRRNLNKLYPGFLDYHQCDSIFNLPYGKDLYMFNDSAGFIIGDHYIAQSKNYTDWVIKYTNPQCTFNKVWFTSKDTGYVVGSKNGLALIMKTQDGGTTWKEQVCPVTTPLNDIKFTADGKVGLIVGDSGTILRTTNGGGSQFVGIGKGNMEEASIEVYPNPAQDGKLYVSTRATGTVQVCIYNSMGNRMYTGEIIGAQSIDITGWANGCYIVQYTTHSATHTQKLIVHHQ